MVYNTMSQPMMGNSGYYQSPMVHTAYGSPPSGIIGSPQNLNTSYLGGSHGIINDGVNANVLNQSLASPVRSLNASNYGPMYGSQMGYNNSLGNSVYHTGVQPVHNALGQVMGIQQTGVQPIHNALGQLMGHQQTGVSPMTNAVGSLLGHGSGINHGVQSSIINQSPFNAQNQFYNSMYGSNPNNGSMLPSGQQVNMHNPSAPYDFNHSKYSPEELNLFEMRRQSVLIKKKKRANSMCGFLPCFDYKKEEIHVQAPDGKSYTKSERPGCFDMCGGGERRRATPDNYYDEKHSTKQKKSCFGNMLDCMTCSNNS